MSIILSSEQSGFIVIILSKTIHRSAKGKIENHILLITNLEGDTDTSQMNEVIESLKKANVLLNVIGLRVPPQGRQGEENEADDTPGPSTSNNADGKSFSNAMKVRVEAFSEILEQLNGESFAFE